MLSNEERLREVRRRAARMREQRERRVDAALGLCTCLLGVCLVGAIGGAAGSLSSVSVTGLYSTSSLLGGETGGYVLVALLSFAAAVAITTICLRRNAKRNGRDLDDFGQDGYGIDAEKLDAPVGARRPDRSPDAADAPVVERHKEREGGDGR